MLSLFYYFHFMSPVQKILKDPSFWSLLVLNLFFIYEYNGDPKQYTSIVWLYWCQSVLIGAYNFFDMLTLKNVNVENLTINNRPATPRSAKGCLPVFFLFHYGIFHFVYLIFLVIDFKLSDTNFSYLKWGIAALFVNLVIQFAQNKIKYRDIPRNIGAMFITPYLRIVPMHLTILLPKFLGWTPGLTFLILKTAFDMIGHLITTRYYWIKEENPESGYI